MTVLYNEIEPYAAQWTRNLVAGGHIADGQVDDRSISDVRAKDIMDVTQFHAFAGLGGWSYALRLAGWPDDQPVWTGSCPCQPFSGAGKRSGFDDERHLWPEWFRLIKECRPPIVFGEQVASGDGLAWLDTVQSDLEREGYTVGAADLSAAGIGAPHIRQRLYFVAHAHDARSSFRSWAAERRRVVRVEGATATASGHEGHWTNAEWAPSTDGKRRPIESRTFPLAHGIPNRVGRLRAIGNAIVPQVAATFIRAAIDAV
jgi:DNA (cytosine-5)-methyltransferase 1